MKGHPLISLIIRTKNEERWIGSCLRAIFRQTRQNFEVILVDNQSTDQTVVKARQFPITLVEVEKFFPGKALNDGIRAAKGEFIVCLSGHCIPVDDRWLENLVRDLTELSVAGVYGRQEPLAFSSPLDKRDLLIAFGLDRKVQLRDSFFHNANSAFRRDLWERFPFDEEVTNIEDRLWAKKVLAAGMKIIYEPEASVYHWHGIHHDSNIERAHNVVRIMEQIQGHSLSAVGHDIHQMNVVVLIPSRGAPRMSGALSLIERAISDAMAALHVNWVYVATDNTETADLSQRMGAVPLIRPEFLSEDFIDIFEVIQWSLDQIESEGVIPDLVVIIEETHPFRPVDLIDNMVEKLVHDGVDSLIAGKAEHRRLWLRQGEDVRDVGESAFMPRQFKKSIAYIGLFGLACVTHPTCLREHSLLGRETEIYEVTDLFCEIEIRDDASAMLLGPIVDLWNQQKRKTAELKCQERLEKT